MTITCTCSQSNPKAPLFFPAYKGKENEHIINMRPFTLCLHRESLIDIISSITNISVPPFKYILTQIPFTLNCLIEV